MNKINYFRILSTLCIVGLEIFFCSNVDGLQKKKKNKEKTDTVFFILSQYRQTGNCLRKDSSTNTAYCDKRSRGICNSNDLILAKSEKSFNVSQAKDIVEKITSCQFSFLNSGISSDSISSLSEEDTIRLNNEYIVVELCEALGITATSTLISETDLVYSNSPKGRIGISADTLYNTPDNVLSLSLGSLTKAQEAKADALKCLNEGFTQYEKDLFTELRVGNKSKNISCSTNGGVNPCPF
ncbi:MAG: hypothetical protein IPL26_03295 [Leptospiraceae bacterium]|nr:hypothetical protein [Leptospiraceae bacterium]